MAEGFFCLVAAPLRGLVAAKPLSRPSDLVATVSFSRLRLSQRVEWGAEGHYYVK